MDTGMNTRYQRRQEIVARKICDETILVPSSGSAAELLRLFVLNPVAEYLWEKLREPRTLEELVHDLLENFDVDPVTARGDVRGFVTTLCRNSLAEEV